MIYRKKTLVGNMEIEVVWFKKDLRVRDHLPLVNASKGSSPILCLFIIEPERFNLPDFDPIHIEWEIDCAKELAKSLEKLGGSLHFEIGKPIDIFERINSTYEISRIHSHQETGNSWSFQRDIDVSDWCKASAIEWIEYPSNGVIRNLDDRDNWKKQRDARMRETNIDPPLIRNSVPFEGSEPEMSEFGLQSRRLTNRPKPGEEAGLIRLKSFLNDEAKQFQWAISSPTLAVKHGSGLSSYLTVGAISMRRVVQETNKQMNFIRENKSQFDEPNKWLRSLASFRKRLAWRCHFIQKLEMEPNLDLVAQNQFIDANLERKMDEERYDRWKSGNTGWPFLDACMRQLSSTGWINFRMRAMIMSAASYNLWLPWRDAGCYLSRQFLDYEPGVHWSQVGMQSGTTGINTVRAYSMTKQGRDQDPDGDYIRTWVPELRDVPTKHIHEPWKMDLDQQNEFNCIIGKTYPEPILDEVQSRKEGVRKTYAARKSPQARDQSKAVYKKHGSRSRPRNRRSPKKEKSIQKTLF